MIPSQTLLVYPLFGDNATKVEPDNNKKSNGWQQSDVVPAEWMNWAWYHNSKGIADLNKGVRSMEAEINAVLANYNITPSENDDTQLLAAVRKIVAEAALAAHPVGSVYQNKTDSRSPAAIFGGGTWAQITDKFLACKGSNFVDTGGGTYTLTSANIPKHRYQVENHTHGMQHYHYTNIDHGHTINDPTHTHKLNGNRVAEGYGLISGGYYYGEVLISPYEQWVTSSPTGITVNGTGTLYKYSEGAVSDGASTPRTITDGATPYTNYYGGDGNGNTTAIDIIPSYQAVYTWYRTA